MADWVAKLLVFSVVAVLPGPVRAESETERTSHVAFGKETTCQRDCDSGSVVSSGSGSTYFGSAGDLSDNFDGKSGPLLANDNCLGIEIGGGASGGTTRQGFSWQTATPKSQGMSSARLRDLATGLASRGTKGLMVIRNDRIVYEWYARGHGRTTKHGTASMAKALVGGVSLAVAISDGRIGIGDNVAKYVPQWKADPLKSQITIRHLGSHTSGIQDAWVSAEFAAGVDQKDFSGWQGDFWRWRSRNKKATHDAFTIARDLAPVSFRPGTDYHYSNPGFGMLSYAVTASLKGTAHSDIRSLLRDRVMRPIGVPDDEWSCGYGKTETVDGLPLVASWGGGSYSANATARVARLVLRNGNWEGKQLIRADAVKQTVSDAGTPNNGAMGWWTNSNGDLGKAPRDALMGEGGGHQVVFIVPSLNLTAVRNGVSLSSSRASELEYNAALRQYLLDPLVNTIVDVPEAANHETRPHPARLPR